MRELAYYNGKWGAPEEISVPFNDRSHFFGDGVYDATIAGNHRVYLLEDHLDRFYSSAAELQINIPMEKAELGALISELTAKTEGDTHFVYWQVTRGTAPRCHAFSDDMQGNIAVYIRAEDAPGRTVAAPVACITHPDTRFEHCNIKTLNLIPSVMAYQKAKKAGVYEAILHRDGVVTECAHSNVSILKDGYFISHPNDNFILRGIGKTQLIKACYRASVQVIERPFTLEELFDADEVIVTASSVFCQPVNEIDGEPVGGKDPATLQKIGQSVYDEYWRFADGK
jgi:D-alanine transaminase